MIILRRMIAGLVIMDWKKFMPKIIPSTEIVGLFAKIRSGGALSLEERKKFKSAMLVTFAEWDWEKGFVQQYHLGALRNNNSRMLIKAGSGYRLGQYR